MTFPNIENLDRIFGDIAKKETGINGLVKGAFLN